MFVICYFFTDTPPTEIYTLSLHDALPIFPARSAGARRRGRRGRAVPALHGRSEEHTSELQSRRDLVCRLLLEKKKFRRDLQQIISQDVFSDLIDFLYDVVE